jgi:hypothetical protein
MIHRGARPGGRSLTPACRRRPSGLVPALCSLALGALALLSIAAPRSARADEAPATLLDWRAPESCPDARAVYDSLSRVLGHAPTDFGVFSRVSGVIDAQGDGWLLTIEIVERGQRLTRLISARRCEDLADAAAVAIGLALERQRSESTAGIAARSGNSPSLAPAPPGGEPSPGVPDASTEPAQDTSGYVFALGADAVIDVNSLPSVAPGLSLHARLSRERLRLALYGTYLPPSELAVREGQAVEFSLLTGGARACYALLPGAVTTAACGSVEAGQYSADGGGLRAARRAANPWVAPAAGLELDAPLWSTLAAELRADALLPLVRKQYAVNETELVYRPPALALRFYVGLSLTTD